MFLSLVGPETADDPASRSSAGVQNNTIIDRSGAQLPRLKKAGGLRAIVGQGATDAMALDLRAQGPHALVGGTTGAGKSEFLQAWVLGMAAAHSPDRVTFLFVDYKGGSAFADCVDLPHCVGLVTDLSPHLVRRALTSLRAELHYREHLLNRKKAKDLLELEKRGDPETPPALVLVIDEFAALAGEVPEFVDGVVDIAQRGRSLGIHLIMATQRPAGVIKDNLRANTNLRIALRMADESDSKDVVGDPIAGLRPGHPRPRRRQDRARPAVPFQSAYAGGWTSDEARRRRRDRGRAALRLDEAVGGRIRGRDRRARRRPRTERPEAHRRHAGRGSRRVRAFRRPAGRGSTTSRPTVDLRELPRGAAERSCSARATSPSGSCRRRCTSNPIATARCSSTARAARASRPCCAPWRSPSSMGGRRAENVEVYGLDFGSGRSRASRSCRMSARSSPATTLSASSASCVRWPRCSTTAASGSARRTPPASGSIASSPGEMRRGSSCSSTDFRSSARSGRRRRRGCRSTRSSCGSWARVVRSACTSWRRRTAPASVPTAVSSNVSRRIVLRLADENAYALVNAPKDVLDERSAPGRAIVDGFESQIAVLGATPNVAEQTKILDDTGPRSSGRGAHARSPRSARSPRVCQPPIFRDRSARLPVSASPKTRSPLASSIRSGLFVVAGPPLSGKTNAMKTLIAVDGSASIRRSSCSTSAGAAPSSSDFAPWMRSATTPDDAKDLATELAELVADESHHGAHHDRHRGCPAVRRHRPPSGR